MNNISTDNVKETSTWLRFVAMVFFGIAFYIVFTLTFFVAAVQFLIKLLTGSVNDQLSLFGASLGAYTKEIISFLTFHSEERPFPFGRGWPSAVEEKVVKPATKPKRKPATKTAKPKVKKTAAQKTKAKA
ncbi:MAG: DUF4389 domain-containing protein [Rhodospirillales bacterium]